MDLAHEVGDGIADLDSSPHPVVLQQAKPSRLRRIVQRIDRLVVATVIVPTALATIYFGLIASDVYISESRFVVRSPQRSVQTGLGALLQGTAFARSQDETYSVHDFIRSRDALRELDEKVQVRAAFSSDQIDVVNRFPGPWLDDSFEAFYRHYQKHVGIEYDSSSSISVLIVRAFTAQDAQRINDLLLQMGERLVNNLNTRSRQDLIQVAQEEVRAAEERAKNAAVMLSSFRSDRRVFDPDRQSALQLQAVGRLQEELLTTEAQLAQIKQVAPDNSQIAPLQRRVDALKASIAAETGKVVGGGGGSLAAKSPAYDRLVLEKTFADRQLGVALAALDTARNEAQRKQLYLERLVQPNLPDKATEPRRLRSVLTVFVIGLVLWGIVSLVLASVREHTE